MIKTTIQGVPTATQMALTYNIQEKLNRHYCVNSTVKPTVSVTWTVADTQVVGSNLYATLQAIVNVTYHPKGCGCTSNLITQTFAEQIVVSFAGDVTTVTPTNVNGYTDPAYISNCNCNNAQGIEQTGVLTLVAS